MLDAQPPTPKIPTALRGPFARARKARARIKAHVLKLSDEGLTAQQVSEACGIEPATLLLWRREANALRRHSPKGQSWMDAHAAEIEAAHRAGEPLRVIAERFGTTAAKICTYAKQQGWPPRGPRGPKGGPWMRYDLEDHLDAIRALYEGGTSAQEIARRFEVTARAILLRARRHGWQAPEKSEEREELIYQYLVQGLSVHGISRNTGINRLQVRAIMRRNGWQTRPGASDELAGAVPRYEAAVRPRGLKPRLAPRIAAPRGLDPAIASARAELKDMALHLETSGLGVTEVCLACGITADTLRRFRTEAGRHRVLAPPGHAWTEDHEAQLRAAWFSDNDISLRALAKSLRLSRWHLNDMAKRRGWPQRPKGVKRDSPVRNFVLSENIAEVRERWNAGETKEAIAERYGVTAPQVSAFAHRQGFRRRPTLLEQRQELVFQCFMDGMSRTAITEQLGLNRSVVVRMIKTQGFNKLRP